MTKLAKKIKKSKLSPDEKKQRVLKRVHWNFVRGIFRSSGFTRFPKLSDKEVKIDDDNVSDFDDVYVYENIVIFSEYTVSTGSDKISTHLRKKEKFYKCAVDKRAQLFDRLKELDSDFKSEIESKYTHEEFIIRFLYCSRYQFEEKHKKNALVSISFLDYPELRYFKSITDGIKHSARPELVQFLGIKQTDIGNNGKIDSNPSHSIFPATLLPEANSNFDPGYKIVSFYADAESLLDRAYVLRHEGWRDSYSLYQRMISKAKIASIRKHLKSKGRVFVNNIIATLDSSTKVVDDDGNTVDPKQLSKIKHVKLQIPQKINSVGLIDGQHRTFSYFVSDPDDLEIAKLRKKQNLLVTGIIYPEGLTQRQRETFEARLFLEINSTQTNAKSDLKQSINRIIVPFSDESIAATVVDKLGLGGGPLGGKIVQHWFDSDKLKTTSVVSYGMKPLVKTSGNDSLFSVWSHKDKNEMVSGKIDSALDAYIDFCASEINKFLLAAMRHLPSDLWTPEKKVKGRLITTTVVNSLLICFRMIVENGQLDEVTVYEKSLSGLQAKDFSGYHSSQYANLADKLYTKYFKSLLSHNSNIKKA